MTVAERLARREPTWKSLDRAVSVLEAAPHRKLTATEALKLGALYRATCADLMLARGHDLAGELIEYLQTLVARAHNVIYRARGFHFATWGRGLLGEVPRRLRSDWTLAVAALVFFGWFLLGFLIALSRREFAANLVGQEQIAQMEWAYSQDMSQLGRSDAQMAGFYIQHNASIGLQCFGLGAIPLLGPLYVLTTQGLVLGAMFGSITTVEAAVVNFYTFVTAHAPLELSAIVLAGAAGLRLGWGAIAPGRLTRGAALRRSARDSLPIAGTSVVLFVLAAFVEGFVSAAEIPYALKALVAGVSALLLAAYLIFGGRGEADR